MSDNPALTPDDDESPEIEFEFSEETLLVIPDDEVIEVEG